MNPVRRRWHEILDRYAALSRREQGMLAALLILGPFFLLYTFKVEPDLLQASTLTQSLGQQQTEVMVLNARLTGLQQQEKVDPDAVRREELARLQAEMLATSQRLSSLQETLMMPNEVAGLLEKLLDRNHRLRLVSLKTLAPESIVAPSANSEDSKETPRIARHFDIYRHGVELQLEGRYADLQAYLEQLEKLQKRVLWENVEFQVTEHPISRLRVTVYTLSADQAWLTL